MAYAGDWDRGLAIARAASKLNPNHAGWHELSEFHDAYRQRDYQRALEAALRLNMGSFFQEPAARAAAYAQLGRAEEAQEEAAKLLSQMPDFVERGPAYLRRFLPPELVDHVIEGWRKAGLIRPRAQE